MIRYAVAVLLLSTIPNAAYAAPVDLKCYLETESGRQDWAITLNEETGTVTYSHPMRTATVKAIFTAEEVIWSYGDLKINRVNLSFVRDLGLMGPRTLAHQLGGARGQAYLDEAKRKLQADPDRARFIDQGKCEVVQVQRAF